MTIAYSVVIPTIGRPSLVALLDSLARSRGPQPDQVVVVDDRRGPARTLPVPDSIVHLRSHGGGPAAAREVGWRATSTRWIVFLDDDVVVDDDWCEKLHRDLSAAADDVGGVQGRVLVPLPAGRRPTDWERGTAGLEGAAWITADMAYRREALVSAGGFDSRFPRAFREDADLALRVTSLGWRLLRGDRRITHPVRSAPWWISLRVQAGNADDVLMARRHGPRWRDDADAPRGLLAFHAATTACGLGALASAVRHRRVAATALGIGWAGACAWFAWRRIAPGPRTPDEIARMAATSVLIPPLATWHRLRGELQHRHVSRWAVPRAVLFDRDGTLVHDVPYNGDPDLVEPVAGAVGVVDGLRRKGIRVGVVTNQSGVARGLIGSEDVVRVNDRIDELFGGFDVWAVCTHDERDGCSCRKPEPGLIEAAAAGLGVPVEHVVVIGDIGTDVLAARAAGARGVLVPNGGTSPDDVRHADLVAASLAEAVRLTVGAIP